MATFTSRTVRSTRREWIIPAPQPWGAAYIEVYKAVAAAEAAYREAHRLDEEAVLADDALRFHVGDDEVIIGFTIEEAA
jgi:hypothetical protein